MSADVCRRDKWLGGDWNAGSGWDGCGWGIWAGRVPGEGGAPLNDPYRRGGRGDKCGGGGGLNNPLDLPALRKDGLGSSSMGLCRGDRGADSMDDAKMGWRSRMCNSWGSSISLVCLSISFCIAWTISPRLVKPNVRAHV